MWALGQAVASICTVPRSHWARWFHSTQLAWPAVDFEECNCSSGQSKMSATGFLSLFFYSFSLIDTALHNYAAL
jgi:hypothetical protein